jgi:hypothetical protein
MNDAAVTAKTFRRQAASAVRVAMVVKPWFARPQETWNLERKKEIEVLQATGERSSFRVDR